MSSRAVSFVSFVFALPIGAAVMLGVGCKDDPKATTSSDASIEAAPEPNRPKAPASDGAAKTCREDCAEKHAAGRAKDEAINACWQASCAAPCIEQATFDGGASDVGTCASPVVTMSEACDGCTRSLCCAAWDACFQDQACAALNACYQTCIE